MGEIVAMQPLERYENSASTCPDEARRLGNALPRRCWLSSAAGCNGMRSRFVNIPAISGSECSQFVVSAETGTALNPLGVCCTSRCSLPANIVIVYHAT